MPVKQARSLDGHDAVVMVVIVVVVVVVVVGGGVPRRNLDGGCTSGVAVAVVVVVTVDEHVQQRLQHGHHPDHSVVEQLHHGYVVTNEWNTASTTSDGGAVGVVSE